MPEIPRDINLDFGIEMIVDAGEAAPVSLPETNGYVPGDAPIRERLTELLAPPTIEQTVLESFRPLLKDRGLLTPTGFQAAHRSALEEIISRREKLDGTADGEKLDRLQEFLSEKQDLTELLTRLRQLLQQA